MNVRLLRSLDTGVIMPQFLDHTLKPGKWRKVTTPSHASGVYHPSPVIRSDSQVSYDDHQSEPHEDPSHNCVQLAIFQYYYIVLVGGFACAPRLIFTRPHPDLPSSQNPLTIIAGKHRLVRLYSFAAEQQSSGLKLGQSSHCNHPQQQQQQQQDRSLGISLYWNS